MEEAAQTISDETQAWIKARTTTGRWLDISVDDVLPTEISGLSRTIMHMFQISFAPEIRRRIESGLIDENFLLNAAQLVQPFERKNFVRLNDEVKGVAKVRASRTVNKGDEVYYEDFSRLEGFDVLEEELDCGHFTIFWTGAGWSGAFDFRSGRQYCLKILDAASEFLEASIVSSQANHSRPAIDNLFSCCELVSKAHLLLSRNRAAESKTHGPVKSELNKSSRLGNIDADFVSLFNGISQARTAARYDVNSVQSLPSEGDFDVVRKEIDLLASAVRHLFADVD